MALARPTFHESWYRVAELRPRLRAAVQTYRQFFRGQPWHVVRDPANNQFFRLSEPAYHFIGLLDGQRTVNQAWHICNEQLGDAAPTQGEVIQTLGQLYASNLLYADLPADAAGMFERYRKRVRREVGSYLMNLLFVRIPLFDPERILNTWVGVVGWVFGPVGIGLWLVLLAVAGWHLVGRGEQLLSNMTGMLSAEYLRQLDHLILLYLTFAIIKALHEFGHGFACKRFGVQSGSGGQVHTIGIMFLVFMPVPYVDASSSYAFRNRWHRAFVGAAGMYIELACAAVAAIVFARTSSGTLAHTIAYNVIFIASVSTLLFNGNPLLRYDGYYILCDLLEMPNLAQRSREFIYYLTKRYLFGVPHPRNPAHGAGERFWLPVYGVASGIYRVFICVAILLFVAGIFPVVGFVLAVAAVITWVAVPIGKFIKYLATSGELSRTRSRAVGITGGTVGLAALVILAIPVPDRGRALGSVEPAQMAVVFMQADGFVEQALPSGTTVGPEGQPLIEAYNVQLLADQARLGAQRRLAEAQFEKASVENIAQAQAITQQIEALDEQIARVQRQLDQLKLKAPFDGLWVSPDIERLNGAFVKRGQPLGRIIDNSELVVRVAADQYLGPRLVNRLTEGQMVQMRALDRPGLSLEGRLVRLPRSGQRMLPTPNLGLPAGGWIAVDPESQNGAQAAEPIFELRIKPDESTDAASLYPYQRVVVRFTTGWQPLGQQWWRALRQMLQRRFGV